MQHRSSQNFLLVAGVIFLAMASAVLGAAFGVNLILSNWTELNEARQKTAALEAARNEIFAANRGADALAKEKELIQTSFANPASPLSFIESIEGLGRATGVEVALSLAGGEGGAAGTTYQLLATGNSAAVLAFLERLESFPFLVEIVDPDFSRPDVPEGGKLSTVPARLALTIRMIAASPVVSQ